MVAYSHNILQSLYIRRPGKNQQARNHGKIDTKPYIKSSITDIKVSQIKQSWRKMPIYTIIIGKVEM